ncbi:MAG: alkaline phosphatase family protein [Solirubrobacteraceae bacterium]
MDGFLRAQSDVFSIGYYAEPDLPFTQAATGTLPALSFVDPAFNGEDQGTSGDEHPHGDVRVGQAFIADVVHAFLESPQFKRGALFIVYDEWGGFFDHVVPPRVPDLRASTDLSSDFGQMGFRIPAVVVSPYARRGYVDHTIYGFESILKMIRIATDSRRSPRGTCSRTTSRPRSTSNPSRTTRRRRCRSRPR